MPQATVTVKFTPSEYLAVVEALRARAADLRNIAVAASGGTVEQRSRVRGLAVQLDQILERL
jgi:hypothetical protein